MIKNMITGNTGEWSELYALAFLLAEGGLYGADENQKRQADLFYEILKVVIPETVNQQELRYEIEKDLVAIFSENKKITSIRQGALKKMVNKMFEELSQKNEGRAYSIQSGEKILNLLKKEGIKASSFVKKDLDLVIVDLKTKKPTPEIGFSIKSQLGGPSTLINASKATNFTFEILGPDGQIPKKTPSLHPKNVKDNIKLLRNQGYKIVFRGIDSQVFEDNLCLIDSNLPKYLSEILIAYYSRISTKMKDLVDNVFPKEQKSNKNPTHKIKEFLGIMALGMMPNTEWDGILTSLGGLLLVKKDGDVLCYYLYNLKEFQEYLLKNTKLETPSTTRYGIGKIIKQDNKFFIKLNLQVRFLK